MCDYCDTECEVCCNCSWKGYDDQENCAFRCKHGGRCGSGFYHGSSERIYRMCEGEYCEKRMCKNHFEALDKNGLCVDCRIKENNREPEQTFCAFPTCKEKLVHRGIASCSKCDSSFCSEHSNALQRVRNTEGIKNMICDDCLCSQ